MKIIILALALAILTPSALLAQGGVDLRGPLQLYNCCRKPLALGAPAECEKRTALDCQNMGGKIVKDCQKCK